MEWEGRKGEESGENGGEGRKTGEKKDGRVEKGIVEEGEKGRGGEGSSREDAELFRWYL